MTVAESGRAPVVVPTVIISQPVLRLENFLNPAQVTALLARADGMRDAFVPATVTTDDASHRRSRVVHELGDVKADFDRMVRTCLPLLRQFLGAPDGDPSLIETQLTVSHHGDFFKIHTDCGSAVTADRLLSFVYYFAGESAAFTGGDLVLYDSPVGLAGHASATRHVVPPIRNSIVFFASAAWHEVTPVVNPSTAFCDGRFTINGWLRW